LRESATKLAESEEALTRLTQEISYYDSLSLDATQSAADQKAAAAKVVELNKKLADVKRSRDNAKGDKARADGELKKAAAIALEMETLDTAVRAFDKAEEAYNK
jgi:hypothetical protein